MPVESPPASPPHVSTPPAGMPQVQPVASDDERWAAWHAKGAAHDRAVRRKLTVVVPTLVVLAAAIFYALAVR
jgi:hypothetical protein